MSVNDAAVQMTLTITDAWRIMNYSAFDRVYGTAPLEITDAMELSSKKDLSGLTTLKIYNQATQPTTLRVGYTGDYLVMLSNGQYSILHSEFEGLLPRRGGTLMM